MGLVERAFHGERRALARLLTVVEDGGERSQVAMAQVGQGRANAFVIGITGSPGSGKSTLIGVLARELRARREMVGVLAVDPSSPYTGGAVLGDRVRMQELMGDPGVFIRSMADRGARGGLSRATAASARVLAACGYTTILVETVGTGQSDVDVAGVVDATVMVLVPGMGDGVQAIKAGILEAADVLVVNKADRTRADQLVSELALLKDGVPSSRWSVPIVKTVATTGAGVSELADTLLAFRPRLMDRHGGASRQVDGVTERLVESVLDQIAADLRDGEGKGAVLELSAAIAAGRIGLHTAATELVREYRNGFRANGAAESSPVGGQRVRRG